MVERVVTDMSPEEQRVGEIHLGFAQAHHHLSMLVHDVSRWIERADKDDEPLRQLMERLRWAETHDEAPEVTDWGVKGTPSEVRLIEMDLEEVAGTRTALEGIFVVKRQYRRLVAEMALINLVAPFEAFIGDLLKCVLTCRPEFLKASDKPLKFADVVEAGSHETLIETLAEREVRSWINQSFRAQVKVLKTRFKADLAGPEDDIDPEDVIEMYARRNVLLHNRGIVNEAYLELAPHTDAKRGERLDTTVDYWTESGRILVTVAGHLSAFMAARHLHPPEAK
jgi:hypothetical protein